MYVPTIDFNAADASKQFTDSLKNTGFAVIKNHPIDWKLVADTYEAWQTFFQSDEPTKKKYLYKSAQDGYYPADIAEVAKGYSARDIKEFYHFYTWGQCPESTYQASLTLFNAMNKMAINLLGWVEAHLPEAVSQSLSMHLGEMINDSPATLLRSLYYPGFTGKEEKGALRAAAHEDICLLTLLPAATSSGLQVCDINGQWHSVKSDPGTIVVNAGDMLQMCTQHYYKSTSHRVVNPTGDALREPRLSLPLFLHPHADVRLSEDYTAGEYLAERLNELGTHKK